MSSLFHLDEPLPLRRGAAIGWAAAGALYLLVIGVALPRSAEPLGVAAAIPLAHSLSLAVVTALTAMVLWFEAARTQSRGYLVLGGTFSTVAVLLVAFPLAFPGALLPPGPDGVPRPLLGGASTAVAIFIVWHVAFAVGAPLAAVILSKDASSGRVRELKHGIAPGVLLGTLPALLLAAVLLLLPDAAPELIAAGKLTPLGRTAVELMLVIGVAGLVTAIVVTRARTVMSRWLIAVCVLNVGDGLLNLNAARYSLGWYTARAIGFVTLSAMLVLLVWELARIDRRTQTAATTDVLTGLRSRVTFQAEAARELARAARDGTRVALLWIDLDRFKAVNDKHGHPVGDAVLVEVSRRLLAEVRASDLVVRMGGDEFVVVLAGLDSPDHATRVADRIAAAMSAPIDLGDVTATPAASVGIAYYPDSTTDLDELARFADAAMYAAKEAGGAQYREFDRSLLPDDDRPAPAPDGSPRVG